MKTGRELRAAMRAKMDRIEDLNYEIKSLMGEIREMVSNESKIGFDDEEMDFPTWNCINEKLGDAHLASLTAYDKNNSALLDILFVSKYFDYD